MNTMSWPTLYALASGPGAALSGHCTTLRRRHTACQARMRADGAGLLRFPRSAPS